VEKRIATLHVEADGDLIRVIQVLTYGDMVTHLDTLFDIPLPQLVLKERWMEAQKKSCSVSIGVTFTGQTVILVS